MDRIFKKIAIAAVALCILFIATNAFAFKWDNNVNMDDIGFVLWPIFSVFGIIYQLLTGILLIGVQYLITVLFPRRVENTALTFEKKPVFSFFVGILAVIGGLITAVLICITIIGIPLGILLGLFIILSLSISDLPITILLGRRLKEAINLKFGFKYSEVIIGGLTILLISFVPVLGLIFVCVAALAGFGSMILSRFGMDVQVVQQIQQPSAGEQTGSFSAETGAAYQVQKPARYDALAIPALICGVLSLIPVLGIIFGMLAIIFGIISIRKIDKSSEPLSGRGAAITGLIVGIIFLVLWIVLVVGGIGLYLLFKNGDINFQSIMDKLESVDTMKNYLAINLLQER